MKPQIIIEPSIVMNKIDTLELTSNELHSGKVDICWRSSDNVYHVLSVIGKINPEHGFTIVTKEHLKENAEKLERYYEIKRMKFFDRIKWAFKGEV